MERKVYFVVEHVCDHLHLIGLVGRAVPIFGVTFVCSVDGGGGGGCRAIVSFVLFDQTVSTLNYLLSRSKSTRQELSTTSKTLLAVTGKEYPKECSHKYEIILSNKLVNSAGHVLYIL